MTWLAQAAEALAYVACVLVGWVWVLWLTNPCRRHARWQTCNKCWRRKA